MRTAVAPGQLGLFDLDDLAPEPEAAPDPHDLPAPCLYNSPARGLAARIADFETWQARYGNFGSVPRSHAWYRLASCPVTQLDRCEPTIFLADQRPWRREHLRTCDCDGPVMYRAICRGRGCIWESPARESENLAAEDGMDHAWPGWRDLPVVPRVPDVGSGTSKKDRERIARWAGRVNAVYPAGWLVSGGPVRTLRQRYGTRHVPGMTPYGGYDLGIPEVAA